MAQKVFDELEREFLMRKRARRKEYTIAVGCVVLLVAVAATIGFLLLH